MTGLKALVKADLDAVRDAFGNTVDDAVRKAQHAPSVARRLLGGELAEGDDLRNAVATVLLDDVLHHALAAVDREVDIDVWHRLASWVEEALEQQVVTNRINVGDLEAVGDE